MVFFLPFSGVKEKGELITAQVLMHPTVLASPAWSSWHPLHSLGGSHIPSIKILRHRAGAPPPLTILLMEDRKINTDGLK